MTFIEYVPSGIELFVTPDSWNCWWKENSVLKHDWLLQSYVYAKRYKENTMREELKIRKGVNIIGDSGGFSLATGTINYLNPIDVLRWEETNVDYGLILDKIPCFFEGSENQFRLASRSEAQPFLKQTAENGMQMLRAKENDKLKLLYICHGFEWDYMNDGLNYLKQAGGSLDMFAGVSISRKGNNPYTFMEQLFWIKEHIQEGQHLHLLGISGFRTTPLIHYIMRDMKNISITYDSTGYLKGSKRREYISPFNIKHPIIINKNSLNEVICDCEICKLFEGKDLNKVDNQMDISRMLCLHNLKMFLNYNKALNKLVEHPEEFRRFNSSISGGNEDLFMVMDYAEKEGFLKAKERYKNKFLFDSGLKQGSIFDF